MIRIKRQRIIIAAGYVAAILTLLVGLTASPIQAQNSPSTPTASVFGDATWAIQSQSFTSQYPNGFTFTFQATSSAGKIKTAQVVWNYAPGAQQRHDATFDSAKNTWTAQVGLGFADATPAWVAVNYSFVLVDEKGNSYQSVPYHTEYADNTKPWGRAESNDVVVFWEKPLPDSVGQMVIDAVSKDRELYRQAFGRLISYKPRVILYNSLESYAEWGIPIERAQGTLGLTDWRWGATVQRNSPTGLVDFAYGTATHEIGHLYQHELNMVGPTWWIEGEATFFELHQMYDYEARARQLAQQPDFPTLDQDIPIDGVHFDGRVAYDIGYSFIKYLVDTYGLDIHRKIVESMGQKGLLTAISDAVGKPFDQVQVDFRTWMGAANPSVPTPLPTLSFVFQSTPTYEPTISFQPTPTYEPTDTPK